MLQHPRLTPAPDLPIEVAARWRLAEWHPTAPHDQAGLNGDRSVGGALRRKRSKGWDVRSSSYRHPSLVPDRALNPRSRSQTPPPESKVPSRHDDARVGARAETSSGRPDRHVGGRGPSHGPTNIHRPDPSGSLTISGSGFGPLATLGVGEIVGEFGDRLADLAERVQQCLLVGYLAGEQRSAFTFNDGECVQGGVGETEAARDRGDRTLDERADDFEFPGAAGGKPTCARKLVFEGGGLGRPTRRQGLGLDDDLDAGRCGHTCARHRVFSPGSLGRNAGISAQAQRGDRPRREAVTVVGIRRGLVVSPSWLELPGSLPSICRREGRRG